jgi:hypothetical protein
MQCDEYVVLEHRQADIELCLRFIIANGSFAADSWSIGAYLAPEGKVPAGCKLPALEKVSPVPIY